MDCGVKYWFNTESGTCCDSATRYFKVKNNSIAEIQLSKIALVTLVNHKFNGQGILYRDEHKTSIEINRFNLEVGKNVDNIALPKGAYTLSYFFKNKKRSIWFEITDYNELEIELE